MKLLLLIFTLLPFTSFTQGKCYNCLLFHGDSISIDSSLSDPYLPRLNYPEKFTSLEDGLWTTIWGENSIYVIFEMKNGRLNGRVIRFAFPTLIDEIESVDRFSDFHYVDGEADGAFTEWWSFKNQIVSKKGTYRKGKKEGRWETHYAAFADYSLYSIEQYKNDDLHGLQEYWHPNGKLMERKEYVKGVPCGMETRYFSNGQTSVERLFYCDSTFYVSDNFDYLNSYDSRGNRLVVNGEGTHKIFYENGKVWKSGPVKNGRRHGEWKKYSESGTLVRTEVYQKGLRIR